MMHQVNDLTRLKEQMRARLKAVKTTEKIKSVQRVLQFTYLDQLPAEIPYPSVAPSSKGGVKGSIVIARKKYKTLTHKTITTGSMVIVTESLVSTMNRLSESNEAPAMRDVSSTGGFFCATYVQGKLTSLEPLFTTTVMMSFIANLPAEAELRARDAILGNIDDEEEKQAIEALFPPNSVSIIVKFGGTI
jgi:hypothetical protein